MGGRATPIRSIDCQVDLGKSNCGQYAGSVTINWRFETCFRLARRCSHTPFCLINARTWAGDAASRRCQESYGHVAEII
jgi:hypothetical protein